jgi:hypothetical protein
VPVQAQPPPGRHCGLLVLPLPMISHCLHCCQQVAGKRTFHRTVADGNRSTVLKIVLEGEGGGRVLVLVWSNRKRLERTAKSAAIH